MVICNFPESGWRTAASLAAGRASGQAKPRMFLFYPDCTVGSGIAPDLLTLQPPCFF